MKIFLTLSCILMMSMATAEEECTMQLADVKSSLDEKSKYFKKVAKVKRNAKSQSLSQVAELVSGEKLSYSTGGCAHIGFTYTYSNLKEKPKDAEESLKLMRHLIEKTGFISNNDKEIMMSALEDKKNKNPERSQNSYILKCGDASCRLDVDAGKISFQYDFAL